MAFEELLNSVCSEDCDKKAIVVVSEKKCEYRVYNDGRHKLCKTKIDGCFINNGRRCDFLVIDRDDCNAYFIELKGSDLLWAIEQIENTIERLRQSLSNCKIFSRIVIRKVSVPNIENNPKILRHKKLIRTLNGNFKIGTCKFEERI